MSTANVHLGCSDLVRALHEQRIHFTSGSAYALRTLKALAGQSDMEQKYQENQGEIDRRATKWNEARERDKELRERIRKREEEIKAFLTGTYNWEFK